MRLEKMKVQRFYILRSSSQEGLECSDTSDPSIGSKGMSYFYEQLDFDVCMRNGNGDLRILPRETSGFMGSYV
jgi:hypothetical protein